MAEWYVKHLGIDIKRLHSWAKLDELHNVANAVKHGEGPAIGKLRELRPALFMNPMFMAIYDEDPRYKLDQMSKQVIAPLSGEEFFLTEELLSEYTEAAESLFAEIAAYFKANSSTYF